MAWGNCDELLRTAILLAGLTALFMGVGYLLGGSGGAVVAFFVAAAMNFVTYWNADRLVLSMHGAREVDEHAAPEFVHLAAEALVTRHPRPKTCKLPGSI
jgi:heat shock protein HtpX